MEKLTEEEKRYLRRMRREAKIYGNGSFQPYGFESGYTASQLQQKGYLDLAPEGSKGGYVLVKKKKLAIA